MDFVGHRFIVPILVFCLYDPVLSWTTIYRTEWILVGHRFIVPILVFSEWIFVGHRFIVPIAVFSEWIFVGHRFIVPILVFCLYEPFSSSTTIYPTKFKTMAR
jgi:hypothetical protein